MRPTAPSGLTWTRACMTPLRAIASTTNTSTSSSTPPSSASTGLGVNELHQNAYGMMPSPQLMAATLSRRTQDVTLLLLGQSIALYNPPTRVAEEMAMLDVMSGGRLVAGFPVGTSMDDNFCFGANPATLRDNYQENHDLILRAWADPDVFAGTASTTRCATSTSGRARFRSRTRRSGSPAAARSRRGTSARTTATTTPTSRSTLTSAARR